MLQQTIPDKQNVVQPALATFTVYLFFTPLVYCLRKRTLCGEMGLILAVYAIAFLFDSQIGLGAGRPFGTTITFMTLGYFSGILSRTNIRD